MSLAVQPGFEAVPNVGAQPHLISLRHGDTRVLD